MNKILKSILIVFGIFIVIGIAWFVSLMSAFGVFDKVYSTDDLKASFEDKKIEIYELKRYFNRIVPKNRFVEIEFSSDHELGRLALRRLTLRQEMLPGPCFWNGTYQLRRQKWIV